MKTLLIICLLALIAAPGFAQSTSFALLKNNYEEQEDVHVFSLDGFFCKAILSLTDDDEFKDAVKNIRSFDLITIPNATFTAGHHTRQGFRTLLKKDNFESIATVKDHGDNVEIFVQNGANHKDRYLVWTEGDGEVTAIEIEGKIDVNKLMRHTRTLAQTN